MAKQVNLTGQVINRFTALRKSHQTSTGRWHWTFACFCGKEFTCDPQSVKNGSRSSCGCLGKPSLHKAHANITTFAEQSVYNSWASMKQRCLNSNCADYHRYGGRGLTISPEWMEFENFQRDMGPKLTLEHTLERKENDKGYSKDNCIWATRLEQAQNRRPQT